MQIAKIESCLLIRNIRYLVLDILVQTKSVEAAGIFEEALMPAMYELKALGATANVTCECWGMSFFDPTPDFDFDQPQSHWDGNIRTDSVFMDIVDRACCAIPKLFEGAPY